MNGYEKLAGVIVERSRREREANSSPVLDFGVINADKSLRTNTYGIDIPQEDYLVLRHLTFGKENENLTKTKPDEHDHEVLIPEKMRSLKPGDRVLVAWVQHDAVVIGIIKSAAEIG